MIGRLEMQDSLRIRFIRGDEHVSADKKIFELYRHGQIGPIFGAQRVGVNNGCEVTPEMFVANAKWLGYDPNGYPDVRFVRRNRNGKFEYDE